jgi:membrane-associated phospholipid phosphatase
LKDFDFMEELLQWGLDFIRGIQSWSSPPLTVFMMGLTHLGSPAAYLILLPLMYWCIDEKKGIRLGSALMVSAWINMALKFFLNQPRPFFEGYDPSIYFIQEHLGGLPSGHAQNSLLVWIIIASWCKKKRYYAGAAFLCLLIGFSRLYLGVHFPTDILGGWILGGLVLCGYFFLGPRIEELLVRGGSRAELIAAALSAFIMILYRPSAEILMPGGILLGMGAGYSFNKRYFGFKARETYGRSGAFRVLSFLGRCVCGGAGAFFVFLIFEKIIPENKSSDYYLILFFLRFVLLGFWVYAGAPWLFQRLRLAKGAEKSDE